MNILKWLYEKMFVVVWPCIICGKEWPEDKIHNSFGAIQIYEGGVFKGVCCWECRHEFEKLMRKQGAIDLAK